MTQVGRFGRVLAVGFCLCGILLAEGCSGGKGVVSGKVSYKGKPIRGGTVSFITEAGTPVNAPIKEDGSYAVRNLPPGTVKITVETESFRPPLAKVAAGRGGSVDAKFMKQSLEKMNPKMADPERAKRYVPLPARYRNPDLSKLTYEVKRGKQQYDIDLQ